LKKLIAKLKELSKRKKCLLIGSVTLLVILVALVLILPKALSQEIAIKSINITRTSTK